MKVFRNNSSYTEAVEPTYIKEIRKFHMKSSFDGEGMLCDDRYDHDHMGLVASVNKSLTCEPIFGDHTPNYSLITPKSARSFGKQKKIDIESLLSDSLGVIGYDKNGFYHRNYPSAGALYPNLTFLVDYCSQSTSIFSPFEKKLYKLFDRVPSKVSMYAPAGTPSYVVLYVTDLEKATFKYGRKGYRHALIETGYMMSEVRKSASQYGFVDLPFSGFDDSRLSFFLELNNDRYIVTMAQLLGGE